MPNPFPSVREILEQFDEQDGDEEENCCLSIQDASGNEIGSVSYEHENNIDLTGIIRGDGMNYILSYDDNYDLERIAIEGVSVPLIQYACEDQIYRRLPMQMGTLWRFLVIGTTVLRTLYGLIVKGI